MSTAVGVRLPRDVGMSRTNDRSSGGTRRWGRSALRSLGRRPRPVDMCSASLSPRSEIHILSVGPKSGEPCSGVDNECAVACDDVLALAGGVGADSETSEHIDDSSGSSVVVSLNGDSETWVLLGVPSTLPVPYRGRPSPVGLSLSWNDELIPLRMTLVVVGPAAAAPERGRSVVERRGLGHTKPLPKPEP